MLTKRWYPLYPLAEQVRYINSKARFNVVACGRRSGKSERAKRKIVRKAIIGTNYQRPSFILAAPTREQAKRVFWSDLKDMIPKYFIQGKPSETELIIKLKTGAEISVVGMDKPERIEGRSIDGIILDEIANMKSGIFQEHVRPGLADRSGWCDFVGTPEGENFFYDLAELAKITDGWDFFHWESADILPSHEIEEAKKTMDPLTFDQEFRGKFIQFATAIYYSFTIEKNVGELKQMYNKDEPLIISLDFNVAPGIAAFLQEKVLGTIIIDEIHIPRNSNTPMVCRKIIEKYKNHSGDVHLYGDSTGGNRGSAKIAGSDWDLVKAELRPVFGDRLKFRVDKSNPRERIRVNAMNSLILSASGERRLFVDKGCKNIIKDFRSVKVLKGSAGEIDKKSNLEITHLTDAIGYYVAKKHPIVSRKTKVRELMI